MRMHRSRWDLLQLRGFVGLGLGSSGVALSREHLRVRGERGFQGADLAGAIEFIYMCFVHFLECCAQILFGDRLVLICSFVHAQIRLRACAGGIAGTGSPVRRGHSAWLSRWLCLRTSGPHEIACPC